LPSLFGVFFVFVFVFVCFFPCGVFFYDDDGDVDTQTLFDDFMMKEILAGRSDDFLGTTNFLTIFLFEDLSGRRTSRYRRRTGFSSPSMPLLVYWPHAGAWGAGVILPPCAQLSWHELYVMKSLQKKKNAKGKVRFAHVHERVSTQSLVV